MKKLITILCLVPALALAIPPEASMRQGTQAIAAAGTAERLVDTSTLVDSVEIHARKNRTTANTGAVYIGFTNASGGQLRVLLAGEKVEYRAPAGKKIDLMDIWVDAATNDDGVVYVAFN